MNNRNMMRMRENNNFYMTRQPGREKLKKKPKWKSKCNKKEKMLKGKK